jgi:hypothetical protein
MMTPKRLAGELERRLDGPHADEHTSATADLAAEAIRFLNYATGSHSPEGLVYPATVYEVAADLSAAADRMPQLFAQLSRWLSEQSAAGMLGTDNGAPAETAVLTAQAHLTDAAGHARKLAAALDAVQNDLAMVNGRGPNRTERAA